QALAYRGSAGVRVGHAENQVSSARFFETEAGAADDAAQRELSTSDGNRAVLGERYGTGKAARAGARGERAAVEGNCLGRRESEVGDIERAPGSHDRTRRGGTQRVHGRGGNGTVVDREGTGVLSEPRPRTRVFEREDTGARLGEALSSRQV